MERREVFVVLRADVGAMLQEQTDHVVMAVKYRHVQRSVAGGCLHVHAQGLVSSHLSLRKESQTHIKLLSGSLHVRLFRDYCSLESLTNKNEKKDTTGAL